MRAVLEFLMIAEVKTLAQAVEIVTDVGHPAGGVLVDALHLARCGATPRGRRVDRAASCCRTPNCATVRRVLPRTDYATYLSDAIDGRSAAGEGELPLRDLLAALPANVPLSLEVRSKRYRERYPDPVRTRARGARCDARFLAVL